MYSFPFFLFIYSYNGCTFFNYTSKMIHSFFLALFSPTNMCLFCDNAKFRNDFLALVLLLTLWHFHDNILNRRSMLSSRFQQLNSKMKVGVSWVKLIRRRHEKWLSITRRSCLLSMGDQLSVIIFLTQPPNVIINK